MTYTHMAHFEIEIKSLLGKKEHADLLKEVRDDVKWLIRAKGGNS